MDADSDGAAQILDAAVAQDAERLSVLRADPRIEFVDSWTAQRAALNRLTIDADVASESPRFAYYPWRRAVAKVLGPRSFRRLRLDRNRNLITAEEQDRLGRLHIGVIGLSAGHVVAHTLALQGLCGELRLADFDDLELSNLNRVPGGVFDLGINKTTVAARRIAEVDPYLTVRTFPTGVSVDNLDDFLDGLDVVVEECDSLDLKVGIRRAARSRRTPVLMATSDRGLIDVERFDLEPDRPIFHGLLGDVDPETLAGLSARDKVPYVLRLIEVGGLSARAAASLLEVGHAVVTWPQLAGDVTLGAAPVAEAVRRIGLCEPLSSGRVRLDVGAALDRIATPSPAPAAGDDEADRTADEHDESADLAQFVTSAAVRAPSGGNVQPWIIAATSELVTIRLDPERTSTIDVGLRGSAVAVGAAVYNARVAAAARGATSHVEYATGTESSPLEARIRLTEGGDDDLAARYDAMLRRETNRHQGTGASLSAAVRDELASTAQREGARLHMITSRADVEEVANIFAAADRIRYLTSRLHEEMISELRWPGDEDPNTGIDVLSLELGPRGELALEILRRSDVMAELSAWDGGAALGDETADGLMASSAVAVVSTRGHDLADYARGGGAVEATWIAAQELGLAVAPISPPFLYTTNDEELQDVSPKHAEELAELQARFRAVAGLDGDVDQSLILVLRLSVAEASSIRSRRRTVNFGASRLR
ncbi:Rv1355c family protein [Mycolicibacterium sp.]|uniref:Rv1355c family protein n=1 Tax=Mycolicibacterium sp. TaxID=2320850 RepID=UPI001A357EC9|nr:Rv1355c family protein [Mycolicibacterium sp.]MBJ7336156.1 Rv1355c family protein [Mycolicibacterium sp.]